MTRVGESSDVDEFPRVRNSTCHWCDRRGPCTWLLPGTWLLCDRCLVVARNRNGGQG